jgi:hypothetical protein
MGSLMALLLVTVVLGLPIAWIASEFTNRRGIRIALGIATIITGVMVADGFGDLGGEWRANTWWEPPITKLLDTTVSELERGHADTVLASFKELQSQFHPNYENKCKFDELVGQAVKNMTSSTTKASAP